MKTEKIVRKFDGKKTTVQKAYFTAAQGNQ